MAPLNSPDDRIRETEVSTLTNAAKISHMIKETTIGPLSIRSQCKQTSELLTSDSRPNYVRRSVYDPWKRDVWRSVDLESERKQTCGSAITLMDCKAIQMKMVLKNAEKMRQKQVRIEMAQRQVKFNELDEMMKNLKIDLIEKSAKKLQKNLLSKEEEVVLAVQQLENNARIADEQTNREIEEYKKKRAEKMNRLKRVEEVRGYFQSIKALKDLFITLFEKFAKTCVSNQQHLKQNERYTQAREGFLARYEQIIKVVNSGQLSSTEVDTLEKICDEVKDLQRLVDEEILSNEELERTIADRNLRLEEQQYAKENTGIQNEQQFQPQPHEQAEQQQQQHLDTVDTPIMLNVLTNFVSNERFEHYRNVMDFYENYTKAVKPLQNDVQMKRFRFDCLKGVNILLNTISAPSREHLQDKFDKLALILSGNIVKIGGVQLTTSQHPLGVRFVNLLVAKKLVNLADTTVSSSPRAAFPIASLIVAIWQLFPDVGKLFLAYFYKACPYLVPYFIPQVEGQSTQEYLKSVGFHFTENVCEEHDKFLKRLSGLVRLYSAVIVSKSRRTVNKPHPHGIENAWIWLTNILNLNPLPPDVSATLIYEFLVTVRAEMWRNYGKQFIKLLQSLQSQYMIRLNEVDTSGGPTSRLEGLLRENKFDPPQDLLPNDFW